MINLIDTHAHLQFQEYAPEPKIFLREANRAGVTKVIVPGTDIESSQKAVEFAKKFDNVYSAIGVHPHGASEFIETKENTNILRSMLNAQPEKMVAIGECGLDYFYNNSPKKAQIALLEIHLQLALDLGLPVIFHIREAHRDFWPILDNFTKINGVLHSFTASKKELDEALKRGLYIGLNGIMTFTKDANQLESAKLVPPAKLVLETDAPFLTPKPYRGTLCEPKHTRTTAEFLANLRQESLEELARFTSENAIKLFNLK